MKERILNGLYRLWGWLPMPDWLRGLIMRTGTAQFLVGVSAVILDEQGRVMLFKHTYRPKMPWGLPGGWLKFKEDPARAVEREVREESGLRVRVYQPVRVRQLDLPGALEVVYTGKWLGGKFCPSPEVSQVEFFHPHNLPPVYPATRRIILEVTGRVRRS